jgi:hypothetical protein
VPLPTWPIMTSQSRSSQVRTGTRHPFHTKTTTLLTDPGQMGRDSRPLRFMIARIVCLDSPGETSPHNSGDHGRWRRKHQQFSTRCRCNRRVHDHSRRVDMACLRGFIAMPFVIPGPSAWVWPPATQTNRGRGAPRRFIGCAWALWWCRRGFRRFRVRPRLSPAVPGLSMSRMATE